MRSVLIGLILLFISDSFYSQQSLTLTKSDIVELEPFLSEKIINGDLVKVVSEKIKLAKLLKLAQPENVRITIYQSSFPNNDELNQYYSLGVIPFTETWTPPLPNHPYGFFIAELPPDKLIESLALPFLIKMDYADALSYPTGNEVVKKTNAELVFQKGYKGKGVKVAVLDSGLDTEPLNHDLPSTIIKKDYSSYPTLDDDVENRITGHGTHVTGLLAGNGSLSQTNIGNGLGKYSGTAPGSELIFLKIGNDFSGGASTTSIVMAMDVAVNIYGAKIISMSYGSWDTFHDGSSTQDQKVDWCYTNGTAVFLAAGNFGNSARHFSGSVNGNDSSDFIQVNVDEVIANSTYLNFNLVWFDGLSVRNNLTLKYYDSNFNELTNSYSFPTTESIRGTESAISQVLSTLPEGSGTYYLRVINHSSNTQPFHIYEHYKNGEITFHNPDPDYTIACPSTADYAFCVGAYVSRDSWTASNSNVYSFNQVLNEVANFSSRGPRIDGLQKPDIVAPGSALISIRDRDVQTTTSQYWIDNDGIPGGDANYFVMEGTSMAAPVAAGCAVLILSVYSDLTPHQLYSALRNNSSTDQFTGNVPNSSSGYGKIDVLAAINDSILISSRSVLLKTIFFIEGAYNGINLSNFLNQNELIPFTQTYNSPNLNYTGEEYVTEFSPGSVDWILVGLKKVSGVDTTIYSKAALLNTDGLITETDGTTSLRYYNVPEDDYYVYIKHRNHLKVMSSSTVHLNSNTSEVYDFTLTSARSINGNALVQLKDGVWGAAAGDINIDEQVNAHDVNSIWNQFNSTGYEWSDINLDGVVNELDKQLAWKNRNIFSSAD